jgi:MoaA/NifB/PqqE/SkfB family radical SAM enzyme
MTEMFLDMHLTTKCNLSCKHCYLHEKKGKDIEYDIFTAIVDDYMTLDHPAKGRGLVLSGGEPTTHPQIAEMIGYVHETYNKHIRMPTNGLGVPTLVENDVLWKNDGIQVSLDGGKISHDWLRSNGSYDTAVEALRTLNEAGIKHGIHFTLHEGNLHSIFHVLDVAKDTGCSWLNVNWFHENGSDVKPVTKEIFDILRNGVQKAYRQPQNPCYFNGCIGGVLGLSVLPDGTYWDCSRNQKVLGKFPDKISDCLFWDIIEKRQTINPSNTCMR